MRKTISIFFFFIFSICSCSCYADAIYSILNSVRHLEDIESKSLSAQSGIYNSQLDIENLMKQVNSSVTGSSGWGTYQFHDYQSYGDGSHLWADVMQMAQNGGGLGALGQAITAIANQFPIDQAGFNNGVLNPVLRNFYGVQSQSVLATRAASELDYGKIQDQIAYQQMLQQQIEKAKDLKSAVDLNNRVQVEANLINLEILRQSSLANEQHAMSDQASLNSALQNAKFLTKQ